MRKPLSQILQEQIMYKGFKSSLSQTVLSTGIQLCQFFCTYLLIHYLTTLLVPNEFGLYSIARATADITVLLANFGLSRFLNREIPASDPRYQNKLFISCLRIEFMLFVGALCLLLLALGPLAGVLKIANYKTLFFSFVAIGIFPLFHNEFGTFLYAQKKIRLFSFIGAVDQFLLIAVLFVVIKIGGERISLRWVCLIFFLAYLLTLFVDNLFLPKGFWRSLVTEPLQKNISIRNPQLIYLLIIEVVFFAFFQIEKFFLSSQATLEAAGIFSYGLTWMLLVWRVSRMPYVFTYPHFAEFFKQGDWANARKSLFFSVFSSLCLAIFGSFIVVSFGKVVFPYVSSQAYAGGLDVMRDIFFIPLLLNIALMGQYLLVLTHREAEACAVFGVIFLIKTFLCWILIPRHGMAGAVHVLNLCYFALGVMLVLMVVCDKKLGALFIKRQTI